MSGNRDTSGYEQNISLLNEAAVRVTEVRHGLLVRQNAQYRTESGAVLFLRGKNGILAADGVPYRVNNNLVFHAAADTLIELEAEEQELEFFMISYHAVLLPGAGREAAEQLRLKGFFGGNAGIRSLDPAFFASGFAKMADLWKARTPIGSIELTSLFYAAVTRFFKEICSERGAEAEPDPVQYVCRYMKEHYDEAVSVQELCDAAGIPRTTLYGRFMRETGRSPQRFLMQCRLEAARRELSESRKSVEEIAVSCGLRDNSYLSRVFKKEYGVPPGAFRKQMTGNMPENGPDPRRPGPVPDRSESVTVESMGRTHRFYTVPQRVVCLDYCAAEMCAALGVSGLVAGVAPAETALSDCREKYREEIAAMPYVPARTGNGLPAFQDICDLSPELVIGTGFSFRRYGGVADAAEFERHRMHVFASKATYMLRCGFESIYDDLRDLARIFRCPENAEQVIAEMRAEEEALVRYKEEERAAVRVFAFDTVLEDGALTCGQSLEDHMIRSAGGVNVFGDRESMFAPVSWEEVADADPQVILVHCFHDGDDGRQKTAFLKRIPEIAGTEAVRNSRFIPVGIKKVFPGVDCTETALRWARLFEEGYMEQ